jgi:hypothetical protein
VREVDEADEAEEDEAEEEELPFFLPGLEEE